MAHSRAAVVATIAAALVGSLVLGSATGWWLGRQRRAVDQRATATVLEVVDGDTIVVRTADGATDTVRLLGVDTPETVHPDRGVECYGPEASAFTGEHLGGRTVRLEDDVEGRDRYDRRLAHVFVDGRSFNRELVARGYARLLVIAPNRLHARELLRAELDARAAGRGLWGAC